MQCRLHLRQPLRLLSAQLMRLVRIGPAQTDANNKLGLESYCRAGSDPRAEIERRATRTNSKHSTLAVLCS